jgi:hypothetical protein
LLRSAAALPEATVLFLSSNETREHVAATNASGRAEVVLDVAGSWLVIAADLRRSPGTASGWDCQIATLHLVVLP